MHSYVVYMLRCSDDSYYIGITNDLHKRLTEHQEGVHTSCYTFKRRPIELIYSHTFSDVWDAIAWEKTLKRWSRKKKEALIRGDQKGLESLAKNGMIRRIKRIQSYVHQCVMVSTDEP